MQTQMSKGPDRGGVLTWLTTSLGRILISLFVPVITFLVLWRGYIFLRDSDAPQAVIVLVAIIWGVGGVALLFVVSNWLVEQLPRELTRRLQPFVFIGPGVASECSAQDGLHVFEDHVYPEIIDPQTGEPLVTYNTVNLLTIDPSRTGADTSGRVANMLKELPLPNWLSTSTI